MKLDVNLGEKPLWSQLYDILSDRIDSSYYKVGEIMPTEMQIMEEFDVSRITVRQAMDKLLSEKKISRRRGKGTIVLEKQDRISTIFQSSFANLKENGEGWTRRLVWVKYVQAPDIVTDFFKIPRDSQVLCIMRHGQIHGEKTLALHLSYIHPITGMNANTDFHHSLYEQYKNYGYTIESVSEEITASIASEEEKKEFGIENQTIALMNRVRRGFHGQMGVEYSISKYLSDGYVLYINNQ